MGNRVVKMFMLLACVLLLAGCAAKTAAPTEGEISAGNTAVTESHTVAATEAPVMTQAQEPANTEATQSGLPYLQKIERPDQSIYQGPGYDYGFVDTVRKQGTYTIVEEAVDYEGYLWGKLKSGIGWVNLTEIQTGNYESALISANYAPEELVASGAYHHYACEQEYSTPVAFHAYGVLRDVTLFAMEFREDGYYPAEVLVTLQEMTAELPLVAELAFPGDMTTYGIRFVDEAGATHVCSIYISGRNGALMLNAE